MELFPSVTAENFETIETDGDLKSEASYIIEVQIFIQINKYCVN